jgi:hypothetical protein
VRWLYEESGGRRRKRVFGDRGLGALPLAIPLTPLLSLFLCSSIISTPRRVHDRGKEREREEEQTR